MRDPYRTLQPNHLAPLRTLPPPISLLDNTQRPDDILVVHGRRVAVAIPLNLGRRGVLPRIAAQIAPVLVLVRTQLAACWRGERVFERELLFELHGLALAAALDEQRRGLW